MIIPGYLTGLTYHANGMILEVKHSNGIIDTHDEDPWHLRRPLRISNQLFQEHFAGGIPPQSEAQTNALGPYQYDSAGNITQVGCGSNAYCRRYHYDGVNRLVEDTDGPHSGYQTYQYDRYGNRTRSTLSNGAGPITKTFVTSATSNHLTSTAYDASGNQLNWGQFQYEWDSFNNLKTLKGGGNHRTYLYTADDERFWTSEFTNTESFDTWTFTVRGLDNKVLTVYESAATTTWSLLKDYIYRDGLLTATENYTEGSTHHFMLDHLGTPRVLTDASGAFVSTHSYFGFGEEIKGASVGVDSEKMVFTGHERDFNSNSGGGDDLDYMHARYCNPNTGRFLSLDPRNFGGPQQPNTWNRFSYVSNNPLTFNDSDGRRQNPVTGQRGIDAAPAQGQEGRIRANANNARVGQFGFTRNRGTRYHSGIDINASESTPLFAAETGTVTDIGVRGAAGNRIQITLSDDTVLTYAHLDQFADGLEQGDIIFEGLQVGTAGTSGNASGIAEDEEHLHFTVTDPGGNRVNPVDWLNDPSAPDPTHATNIFLDLNRKLDCNCTPGTGTTQVDLIPPE